jgi:septal ring factor EnvC (AmiA/AmiB activator)
MATASNGTDSASPIAMLTAEMSVMKQRVTGLESRLDAVVRRLDAIEIRLDAVEKRLDALERRLGVVESKLAELGERVARLEAGIEYVYSELKILSQRQITDFRLMFGSLITVAIGLSGMMAKGFGWL